MKSYILKQTREPNLYRVADREGNWEHYAYVQKYRDGYDPEKGGPTFSDIEAAVYLRGSTTILGLGYAKDPFFIDWISRHTSEERDRILKAAGERGDMVHRFIEIILTSGFDAVKKNTEAHAQFDRTIEIHNRESGEERMLTNDEWDAVLSWAAFWKAHEPRLIATERSVYSLGGGYAGTLDALLVLTKSCGGRACPCAGLVGKVGLWDWKTSSGIYPSYAPQFASYAHADNIPALLPSGAKIEYTAALQLGTKHKNGGFKIEAYVGEERLAYDLNRFKAAKLIADHDYTPFDPESDVIEVADVIDMQIALYVPEPVVVVDVDAQAAPVEEPLQPTLDGAAPPAKLPKTSRKKTDKAPIKKSPKKKTK